MVQEISAILYGFPPPALVEPPPGAVQVSPLSPGSTDLATLPERSLDLALIAAPPGSLERKAVIAQALRALKPGAALTVLAPKDKGGSRLKGELQAFGCVVEDSGRRHHRICCTVAPEAPTGLEEAVQAGAPRFLPALQAESQPGVFSWDRLDPGTAILLSALPALSGEGVDLGCGVGLIARQVLTSTSLKGIDLVDIDRRAIDAARRNIDDPRARFHWADVRRELPLKDRDFVVMNPPFHDGGTEDKTLGQTFIRRAREMLKSGGALWLVANRHLPYEAVLAESFSSVKLRAEAGGFKVFEARR